MRLLNTSTLKLTKDLYNPPMYAILSHTWGEEEVTFEEYGTPAAVGKLGQKKIEDACRIAKSYRCEYIWIVSQELPSVLVLVSTAFEAFLLKSSRPCVHIFHFLDIGVPFRSLRIPSEYHTDIGHLLHKQIEQRRALGSH